MEKQRQIKILSIIALVLAIAGMSLGFAAFSATLNISSSASVSPDSSDFSVRFIDSSLMASEDFSGLVEPYATEGASGSSVYVNETYIDGLSVNFTGTGQRVSYEFWVANFGKYDAYLKEIRFLNVDGKESSKICTPVGDTTASLVSAACDDIHFDIYVNDAYASTSTLFKNKILPINDAKNISFEIYYSDEGDLSDGPFNVEFGDIEFIYSNIDNEDAIINFAYSDSNVHYELQAELGMTWEEWVNSEYNTIGAYTQCRSVVLYGTTIIEGSNPNREISANHTYGPGRLLC